MAWQCSSKTNSGLLSNLLQAGLLTPRTHTAMLAVDRAHYLPPASQLYAYDDSPQVLGPHFAGATISAPHMHAAALEHLAPAIGEESRVLDVGSGSGYLVHVLSQLCPRGQVVGVDHLPGLVEFAVRNLQKSADGRERLVKRLVRVVLGDGRKGYEDPEFSQEGGKDGYWDAIHVGAAAVRVHDPLIKQLRNGGRLFIPVEDDYGNGQTIWLYQKDDKGRVQKAPLMGVRYVPLTDAPKSSGHG